TPPHLDAGNAAHGWCTDTSAGEFNPDKGGHLVLWNLRLVIHFPPGSTILFPSALLTHSNIPVSPDKTRYSIVQYSAGGLFRWRCNGWCSDKTWYARASREQKEKREQEQARRWKVSLGRFTRWNNLLSGDWQGQKRTDAGLDDLSEQEGSSLPKKRVCQR
ncbi:hypothetical protein BDP27DRAFT_1248594, partial [Rhodocollybia butyracea]